MIYWYAVYLLFAIVVGFFIVRKELRHDYPNIDNESVLDLHTYVCCCGLIGSRLAMLIYEPSYYYQSPLAILMVSEGGMTFIGSIVGGVLGCFLFQKTKRQPQENLLRYIDLGSLVVPLIGLGRAFNLINREILGKPFNGWWAVCFDAKCKVPRHPTQLYEMMTEGVMLLFLSQILISKFRKREGITFSVFMIWYGFCRFFIEIWKEPDVPSWYGDNHILTINQVFSLLMASAGLLMFFFLMKDSEPLRSTN